MQALLVVNFGYLISLSLFTVPLYSLLVHMGGDFKAALVPGMPITPVADPSVCMCKFAQIAVLDVK